MDREEIQKEAEARVEAGAVQECLLGREKSFNKLFGILLYVLGIGDTKLKML